MNMKVVIEERIKEAQKNRDQSIFVLRHELKSDPELKAYLKKKIMRYVHCMENSGLKDMKYFLKV